MSRVRPTEVRALAALLNEPADSSEDLARRCVETLDDLRAKRKEYVVVVNDSGLLSAWGPYATVKECQRAVGDPIIACKPGAKGFLLVLHRDTTTPVDDDT